MQTSLLRFSAKGAARIIELNRPTALHALNLEMIEALLAALTACNVGTKARAFCAGGDVVALLDEKICMSERCEFFRKEYSLNHLLGTFSKPIVSLIDGITMGGGVGISVHGQFRVASENTLFAMPETAIGFFPDVGGSFFLPRLEGALGMYLALTGARLKGQDAYHAGIATHYVPSTRIADLEESLAKAAASIDLNNLGEYIEQFSAELEPFSFESLLPFINHCFGAISIKEIAGRLESLNNHPVAGLWAQETIQIMNRMSPTAMAATYELIQQGRGASLKECLIREFNLAKNFLQYVPDMRAGITAKLVNKSKDPVLWSPPSLEQIDPQFIRKLFGKNTAVTSQINFINDCDYQEYPHVDNALPTFEHIKALVEKYRTLTDVQALIDFYCAQHYEKSGLRQKLTHVLRKHVRTRKEMEHKGYSAINGLNWVEDLQ